MKRASQKLFRRGGKEKGLSLTVDANSLPVGKPLKNKNFGSYSKGERIDTFSYSSSREDEIFYSRGSIRGISL